MNRAIYLGSVLSTVFEAFLNAQTASIEVGATYDCANNQSYRVISCIGAKNSDSCEIQSYNAGQPTLKGSSERQQVTALVKGCKVQRTSSPGGAQTAAKSTAAAKAAPASPAAKPPRPGLISCAGKFEGRYAPSTGLPGPNFVFRSGKVTMSGPLVDPEEVECWMGDGRLYFHRVGEKEDLPIEINDDGTLQTPFGELKKKGN